MQIGPGDIHPQKHGWRRCDKFPKPTREPLRQKRIASYQFDMAIASTHQRTTKKREVKLRAQRDRGVCWQLIYITFA